MSPYFVPSLRSLMFELNEALWIKFIIASGLFFRIKLDLIFNFILMSHNTPHEAWQVRRVKKLSYFKKITFSLGDILIPKSNSVKGNILGSGKAIAYSWDHLGYKQLLKPITSFILPVMNNKTSKEINLLSLLKKLIIGFN